MSNEMINRQHGFTMIELLVTIGIAGILMALAAPSFTTFIQNTRLSSTTQLLISDLNQARSEAIKRNVHVLVCTPNNAQTDCAASTNWQTGWLVCAEGAVAGQCAAGTAANPNPVRVRPALGGVMTLVFATNPTSTANQLRFNPNSTQYNTGSAGSAVNLTLAAGATTRVITVAATGHISKQ